MFISSSLIGEYSNSPNIPIASSMVTDLANGKIYEKYKFPGHKICAYFLSITFSLNKFNSTDI